MPRSTMSRILIGVLVLSMASAIMAAPPQQVYQHRKLMQAAPWLRLPAYETINPGQAIGAIGVTLTDNLSYGFLGDTLGDFFDASFEYGSNILAALGR